MADSTYLIFKCLNAECGKAIKLKRPAKSGVYPVICPHCKCEKKLRLKGLEELEESKTAAEDAGKTKAASASPDNSDRPTLELKEEYVTGKDQTFVCPHCNVYKGAFNTQKAGKRTVACPTCKGKFSFEVIAPPEGTKVLPDNFGEIQTSKGKLTLVRKGWLNKSYPLATGKNTIGRYDETLNSDIAIKNDPLMSRRSVEIDVVYGNNGYEFKITVLKSTNPVTLNGEQLKDGTAVGLNFGDLITMGKTQFRFEKEKK